MSAWLWWMWLQIWPNLAASLIWATPAFITHHLLMRRYIRRLHSTLHTLAKGVSDAARDS